MLNMFTAKDALYQSMAYTDKKTGGSPSPTFTFNPFIAHIAVTAGEGYSLNGCTYEDVWAAWMEGRPIYLKFDSGAFYSADGSEYYGVLENYNYCFLTEADPMGSSVEQGPILTARNLIIHDAVNTNTDSWVRIVDFILDTTYGGSLFVTDNAFGSIPEYGQPIYGLPSQPND